jgi:hypothetical protein
MFPHQNIHKYNWSSPDETTHNQNDHILIDRRWHSSICDVQSFRGADCDTDHYLVVAKVRERLAVRKQAAKNSNVERFYNRKLSELEVRKQYQIKIPPLENLNDSEDINRVWEDIKETIKTSDKDSLGLYELKQQISWVDEECLQFFHQTKQAKMQWLQDANQRNVDNLNNTFQ